MRLLIAFLLSATLLSGCANLDAKAEAKVNTQAEIKTQVETFLKAHLESLIKAQVDTKVQGVGIDVKNKLADQLTAEIKHDLQTQVDAMFAKTTQNTGMFSGGAVYVVIVAIAFLVLLFGTIIYLAHSVSKWKKVWHLISESIEKHADEEEHTEPIRKIKSHFSTALKISGLKELVDQNLKKRGFIRKS